MNVIEVRDLYVKKVIEAIPSHINPVDYLVDVLKISRVSVYRRLKSTLPFTYDEIMILSATLRISLDDIMCSNVAEDKAIFSFQQYEDNQLQDYFLKILKNFQNNLKEQDKYQSRTALISINHLWLVYAVGYEHLLKFHFYKWMHQISFNSYRLIYPEIHLSDEIIETSYQIRRQVQLLMNTVFIIDKRVFFNTIEEIQYYYRRNIIDLGDLTNIKNDLEKLIEYTESHVLMGKNKMGKPRSFYLSSVNIYSNSLYVECDEYYQSFFYEYTPSPFRTTNTSICIYHKKWLESLKKYSILMTASNEALQIDFFSRQKRYLDDLMNDRDLIL